MQTTSTESCGCVAPTASDSKLGPVVTPVHRPQTGRLIAALAGGFALGVVATAVAVVVTMPKLMIVTDESPLGFDETVARLEQSLEEAGWSSPGTMDMQKSLAKQGVDFDRRVKVIKLCHPDYAADVLTTDRHVSCLMPCSISVWEDDQGKVHVSKMNTGLMGKMFGGNIAEVMGTKVAKDEKRILSAVHSQ